MDQPARAVTCAVFVLLGNEAYQTLAMDCPLSGWYDTRRRRRPAVT